MERIIRNYSEYTDKRKTYRYLSFSSIADSEIAYFVGYFAGDGSCNTQNKNGREHIRIGIDSTEKYILEYLRDTFCPDSTINTRTKIVKNKQYEINELRLASKLVSSLRQFGVIFLKPNRSFIGIPKKFFKEYLHGLFDADGCIYIRHRKDCRTPRCIFDIAHTSEKLLAAIQYKLVEYLGIPSTIRQQGNVYHLKIEHTEHSKKLFSWLYDTVLPVVNKSKQRKWKDYESQYVACKEDELLENLLEDNQQLSSTCNSNEPGVEKVQRLEIDERIISH